MNGDQHCDITLCACHLAGVTGAQMEALIEGAGSADYLADVRCDFPFHDSFPGTWSALCHFEPGYRWDDDPSLGVLGELGEAGLHLARAAVAGTLPPMARACWEQPGAVLSDFRFPSAVEMAAYWAGFPASSVEWGRALHLVQDALIHHHARGMLLGGHQDFEDALESAWNDHRRMIAGASDPKACAKLFIDQAHSHVFQAATVVDLVAELAEQTRAQFPAGDLAECSPVLAIDICARAVGATMRAVTLMTKAA